MKNTIHTSLHNASTFRSMNIYLLSILINPDEDFANNVEPKTKF